MFADLEERAPGSSSGRSTPDDTPQARSISRRDRKTRPARKRAREIGITPEQSRFSDEPFSLTLPPVCGQIAGLVDSVEDFEQMFEIYWLAENVFDQAAPRIVIGELGQPSGHQVEFRPVLDS